ncbi:hypothetical protein PG993_008037 [Apiospora rasikravindrae]|uniref:Uncharacterized protein n=1 Tax=Apiospora rasikravindrae TaxID=990691 RepID=A0ABR1SZ81_9PEZI
MRLGIALLYLQYITGVLGAGRYVIDKISCTGNLYANVNGYINNIQQWAAEICITLEPYIQDPTPANRPDELFMDLVVRLFGKDDLPTLHDLYSRYDGMRQYVLVDVDNRSNWWKYSEREPSDLEVFCNPDYIIWKTNPQDMSAQWWDPTRDCPVQNENLLIKIKSANTPVIAVASPAVIDGNQERPSPSTPGKLQKAIDKEITFNDKRVKKALSPSLYSRVKRKVKRTDKLFKQVDLLDTVEMTLVHEDPVLADEPSRDMWSFT